MRERELKMSRNFSNEKAPLQFFAPTCGSHLPKNLRGSLPVTPGP
jgi:hypothetical protein